MIAAACGPTTHWAGRTITREGEVFVREGHDPSRLPGSSSATGKRLLSG